MIQTRACCGLLFFHFLPEDFLAKEEDGEADSFLFICNLLNHEETYPWGTLETLSILQTLSRMQWDGRDLAWQLFMQNHLGVSVGHKPILHEECDVAS